MEDTVRALTLWQPWCWTMTCGLKQVENRSWSPPDWLLGQDFALHAGKKLDRPTVDVLSVGLKLPDDPELPDTYVRGAITAIATLAAVVTTADQAVELTDESQRRFFFGPYGWILDDIRELSTPVPCRGFQGLWTILPQDLKLVADRVDRF